jgi:hypothetical protein
MLASNIKAFVLVVEDNEIRSYLSRGIVSYIIFHPCSNVTLSRQLKDSTNHTTSDCSVSGLSLKDHTLSSQCAT